MASELASIWSHRDARLECLYLEHVIRLRDALIDIHSGKLKSNGIYPVSYKVDERVELLSEPKWLQDWDPIYPELNLKKN